MSNKQPELEQLAELVIALGARVTLLESKVRAGQHGLGWDSVRWVRTREAARVFGVTQQTVEKWCRKGWIPAARWPNPHGRRRQHRYLIPAFWMMGLPELQAARVNPATPYEGQQRKQRLSWYQKVERWRAQQRARVNGAHVDLGTFDATVSSRGPGSSGGA